MSAHKLRVVIACALPIHLFAIGMVQAQPAAKPDQPARAQAKASPKLDRYGDPIPAGAVLRLGTVRLRHGGHGASQSLLFSADGKLLLSSKVAHDGVRCWDPNTGKLARTVKIAQRINWNAVALSPDSKILATAADDGARLWDFATGEERRQLRSGQVRSLSFTPDSQRLVCGGGDVRPAVRVFDVKTGKEQLRILGHRREVDWVRCAPNGKLLLSASPLERTVLCTNLETGELKYTLVLPEEMWTPAIALSGDGQTFALGGYSGDREKRRPWLSLYDANRGKEIGRLEGHDGFVYGLAFSPDGKTLASVGEDKTLRFWDVAAKREIRKIETRGVPFGRNLAFSPDGQTLAVMGESAIVLWDVATGARRHAHDGHEGAVYALGFSRDGALLASGADDHTVRIWNLASGDVLRSLRHPRKLYNAIFMPDGKTLLTFGMDWCFRFWDFHKGEELRKIAVEGRYYNNVRMSLTEDGKTLFAFTTRDSGRIAEYGTRAWHLPSGKQTLQREVEFGRSYAAASPDGKLIATHGRRGYVLQEAASGKELITLETPEDHYLDGPFVFTPDGKLLAARSRRPWREGMRDFSPNLGVRIYDVASGKELHHLPSTTSYGPVVFSPDGKLIVFAGDVGRGSIDFFDVASGKQRRSITGCGARVQSLAFSPKGKRLAAGLDDSSVLVWEVK